MHTLASIAGTLLILFTLISLGLGVVANFAQRKGSFLEKYFLGNRSLGAFAVALTAAVMSSVNRKNLDRVLLAVMKGSEKTPPPASLLESLLRLANALGDTKALATLLKTIGTPEKDRYAPWQFGTLAGLLDALDERNTPLSQLQKDAPDEMKAALKQVSGLFSAARTVLTDERATQDDKRRATLRLEHRLDELAERRRVKEQEEGDEQDHHDRGGEHQHFAANFPDHQLAQ